MILEWMDISWECTETRKLKKPFNTPYCLHNSSVFLKIMFLKKQLGILMIISFGKGAMYFSRLFFIV